MPLSSIKALVKVISAWESLFTGGVLLGLSWLVHRVADFDKKSSAEYRGPIQYSNSAPGRGKKK